MVKIAVIDDYADVALSYGDWSIAEKSASIMAFREHLSDADIVEALQPFEVICTLRERTFLSCAILERLPELRAVVMAGPNERTIDRQAAADRGIRLIEAPLPTNFDAAIDSTTEFVWGLIVATVRHIPQQANSLKQGVWQHTPGMYLGGKTLGVVGLGRFGAKIARIAQMFGMRVLAWSEHLTDQAAVAAGAQRVDKERLFRESDIVSVHYVLSDRSRGLVGASEFALMKPTAYLINTSRGPIVDEDALLAALQRGRIAGAGLDVFDREPLSGEHPLLKLDNVVATPHLGFITEEALRGFYEGMASAVTAYVQAADDVRG